MNKMNDNDSIVSHILRRYTSPIFPTERREFD